MMPMMKNQIQPSLRQILSPLLLIMLLFALVTESMAKTASEGSLWTEIKYGFKIKERKDPRLTKHILWFKDHPEYVTRVMNRARPYLFHIVRYAKRRNLPLELALLPAIESAFRPYAYSSGNASGLWQFIPTTAKEYGLQNNWWVDQRRDAIVGTKAALHFLKDMSRQFKGDWLLALAAYNTGAGNVRKAINKNKKRGKPTDFWSLPLPKETQGYVPRILALARFIETAERYKYKLPEMPNKAQTGVVKMENQIDLSLAAEMASISLEELYQLNPALKQWATPPQGPHDLLLPKSSIDSFQTALKNMQEEKLVNKKEHPIQRGESLSVIAQQYGISVDIIRGLNGLKNDRIIAGKTLQVPAPRKPMKTYTLSEPIRLASLKKRKRGRHKIEHIVKNNETLWHISRKYNVGYIQLASWNGMAPKDILNIGKKLVVWRN